MINDRDLEQLAEYSDGDPNKVVNVDTGEILDRDQVDPKELVSDMDGMFAELQSTMAEMEQFKQELADSGIEMPEETTRYQRRILKKKLKEAEKKKKMQEYKLNKLAKAGKVDLSTYIPDELKTQLGKSTESHTLEWRGPARINYSDEE